MFDLQPKFRLRVDEWSGTFAKEIIKAVVISVISGMTLLVGYLVPFARSFFIIEIELQVLTLISGFLISVILGGILAYALLRPRAEYLLSLVGTDELTGLYNSRELNRRLENEISRADRHRKPLSLILIDLDNFKNVNDQYGYEAGDFVLQEFARVLRTELRDADILFRYKLGDEFVALLPDTPLLEARVPAERLRGGIERYQFSLPRDKSPARITISAGVVCLHVSEDSIEGVNRDEKKVERILKPTGKRFLTRAEEKLAEAKKARNSIVMENVVLNGG